MRLFLNFLICTGFLVLFLFNSVWAANTSYYVDATRGGDFNTGRSHAQAWKTIAKVGSFSFASGDNVYFLCGETWSGERLGVDWAGTEADPVVIGAYYMDGATETVGVNGDGKPIIQGTLVDANNKYPSKNYGLIDVRNGEDWVTVQDLEIKDSGGNGIAFLKGSDNCTVQRCIIDHTYQNSILFYSNNNGMAEYNTVSRAGKARILDQPDYWPGGIAGSGTKTVRYNTVYNMWGEGISPTDNGIVMYNLVYDTMSIGIYIQGRSGVKVAYNLILGTNDTTFERWSGWHNSGIKIVVESKYNRDAHNNIIHHNVVINTYAGIHVHNQNADYKTYTIENNRIYNNTFIDNKYNVYLNNNNGGIDYTNTFKNNLSYDNHADSTNIRIVTPTLSNWVADYNQWYPTHDSSDDALKGGTDIKSDPALGKTTWRKTTTLNDLSFTISDLTPNSSETGNRGVDLGDNYDDGWSPATKLPPNAVTTLDQDLHGTGWGMSAIIHTTEDSKLVPPANFRPR